MWRNFKTLWSSIKPRRLRKSMSNLVCLSMNKNHSRVAIRLRLGLHTFKMKPNYESIKKHDIRLTFNQIRKQH